MRDQKIVSGEYCGIQLRQEERANNAAQHATENAGEDRGTHQL